jgi:hypothetical protein
MENLKEKIKYNPAPMASTLDRRKIEELIDIRYLGLECMSNQEIHDSMQGFEDDERRDGTRNNINYPI